MVLENPLNGYIIQTENIPSGSLITGNTYIVTSGIIGYGGSVYAVGQTFVCTNANGLTFTGTGTVKYNLQKRKKKSNCWQI